MQSRNHLWRDWSLLAADVSFNWIIPSTQTLKRMLYNIIWNVNVISCITLIINSFVGWIYHRGFLYCGHALLIILILCYLCTWKLCYDQQHLESYLITEVHRIIQPNVPNVFLQEISFTKKHTIFHITIKILYLPINLPVCRGVGQFSANWMKTMWKQKDCDWFVHESIS